MSKITVEQEDLQPGYTVIESTHVLLGTSVEKVLVMKANNHPRMRLLVHGDEVSVADGDPITNFSFVLPIVDTTGNLVLDVVHVTGVVAGRSGAQVTIGVPEPISLLAAATDEPIFEADEDIYLLPSTANGNAADVALIVLKFEVVN